VWPKVPDQHKPDKPLVLWGLGVTYVLFATIYLFLVYFLKIDSASNGVSASLTLAVCILFGGFMGMLDDWIDLKWRYKAFMPLIAALPLMYYAIANSATVRTSISLPFIGLIQFGDFYYFLIIPLIVMIVTNAINMLGGLNGLETVCPAIVLIGLIALSPEPAQILLAGPLIFWLILSYFNVQGKLFVGNTGSFAIGLTVASFAVVTDLKSSMLISIIPYVFNSAFILLSVFFVRKKANVVFDGKRLMSDHRRSLVTLITYHKLMSERRVVAIISVIVALFTALGILYTLI
jgi:UDP-N-acetylmuramyl pentapeptide phosphotransferase/UDP-N-acetylglucosamine-1-phosphate transferase